MAEFLRSQRPDFAQTTERSLADRCIPVIRGGIAIRGFSAASLIDLRNSFHRPPSAPKGIEETDPSSLSYRLTVSRGG